MEDRYLTIKTKGEGFYSEKRSKFLAFAFHIGSLDEAKAIVQELRKRYYDARHVCYAYVLGADRDVFRSNDDGEPSSTAGKPILGQLNSRSLTDTLVAVVRYYGGVNLGTGGLIVAYREAAADALRHAEVEERTIEEAVRYTFPYVMTNGVMRLAKEFSARITEQTWDNTCTICLMVPRSQAARLREKLEQLSFQ